MNRPRSGPVPKHRRGVDPRHFSLREVKGWVYRDNSPHGWKAVANRMIPYSLSEPHMVLCDGAGTPRFALRYEMSDKGPIRVMSIQRERTEYEGAPPNHQWSSKKETAKSKEFQERLGGVHPAEFLLSEFLIRHRDEITRGMAERGNPGLVLSVGGGTLFHKDLYDPLIDRFFRKRPIQRGHDVREYGLSPQKRRVREALGI